MNDFDRLFDEMATEYPELADLYNHFHAGDIPEERMRWEYERGDGYRNTIDRAKDKYLIILQDMGLFQNG